jgi:hypothetical protein
MLLLVLLGGTVAIRPAPPARGQQGSPQKPEAQVQTAVAPGQVGGTTLAVPAGRCCLYQLHKKMEGRRNGNLGTPYQCGTGQTSRGTVKYEVRLASEGPPCDQPFPGLDLVLLEASGDLIRRADGFADFSGTFVIRPSPGASPLFAGTIEAFDRVGTHHNPFGAEACNQPDHLEGWLTGSAPTNPKLLLRALLVAKVPTPLGPTGSVSGPVAGSLDGTIIQCP